jgi:beta-phosphoglucomutase
MTALRGVIWDMDGVIVDTGEFHFQSWTDTLAPFGIPFSRQLFNKTFGMNNEGILKLLKGEDFEPQIINEISENKESRFRELIQGRVKTLPGALALLESISRENIPQAIGSSAPQKNIDAVVDELDLGSYFDAYVSAAEMPGKPDPSVFLTAARVLKAPAYQCIVIEDAIAGVEAAQRAGMKCVAVTTTHSPDSLQAADKIVQSLEELTYDSLNNLVDG